MPRFASDTNKHVSLDDETALIAEGGELIPLAQHQQGPFRYPRTQDVCAAFSPVHGGCFCLLSTAFEEPGGACGGTCRFSLYTNSAASKKEMRIKVL